MSTRAEFEAATAAQLATTFDISPESVSFRYDGPEEGHKDITAIIKLGNISRTVPIICLIGDE